MIKLVLILASSGTISFVILYFTGGVATPVFTNTLGAFITVTMVFGALSFALYNFLDGITKDLPKKLLKDNPDKYRNAVKALNALKREVISNIVLIIALLLIERILLGVNEMINGGDWNLPDWVDWGVISARVACLVAGIYAALIQFRGFLTANELRTVLMNNGE